MPFGFIKSFFDSPLDNDDYWDKKASALTYMSKAHAGEVDNVYLANSDELYAHAVATVGNIDFNALLTDLEIEDTFEGLTSAHEVIAVAFGIVGVLTTVLVNSKAKWLEEKFLSLHKKFKPDGASPLDYRTGKGHRYIFGHDGNFFQELPEGYTFTGEEVGGKSLYQLVTDYIGANYPGAGVFTKHLKAVSHIFTHYLSDLPTKDGLPLPFTSLFTKWSEDATKASGYSASNPVMDALGREFGTINFADMSSYAVIKLLLTGHHHITFGNVEVAKDEKELHHAQMSTIAYGTALYIQTFLLAIGVNGNKIRTAKMNYLIAGPFVLNSTKSVLIATRMHKKVVAQYEESIAMLKNEEVSIEQWVKAQAL
ncbi:hypothetical protein [Salinicola aestuarinus]|uniref:hypothetical protein n=1 Tax=Salinicola aestuarinus TaxID=1949082 RepID=UPI000DA1350D|nr:hypothetical protein [Salinicola aestuarinus]